MRTILLGLALALTACGSVQDETLAPTDLPPITDAPIKKCMNLGSALEATYEGEWGYTVRREDMVRLKEAGFDTVRLPVRWSVHAALDAPYDIEPDLLQRVEEIVGWADEIGLQVIVNVHHYDALNDDPETHEPRLEAFWDQISSHFVGAAPHLIFEIINEPHSKMTTTRTDALNNRVLARLRREHPDRWVILGTAFWGNLDALQESQPAYDPRAILTYHDYAPFEFTHQGAPWTDQRRTGVRWGTRRDVDKMIRGLDQAAAIQAQRRMPVFVGEFGVYKEVPIEYRARWTKAMRTGLEARGMGWCYWDFSGSLKAYDLETESWLPEIRAALLD